LKNRQLIDVELEPAIGSRFQPTGFPDLGAAVFDRPTADGTWEKALLVESAQSMANRLEGVAWSSADDGPDPVFEGLPYLRVVNPDGDYVTSSRTEAHRLASAFIKDSTVDGGPTVAMIGDRLGLADDRPIPARQIAAAVFSLDPFCLVHGVFFADKRWLGQPKIARAVTGMVEAHDVRRADSGGVKKDHVRHHLGDGGGTAEGYGTVPFHRTEWTAAAMIAMFNLDLAQLRSYGLPDAATELLANIARWEIRSLLEGGLRLRTACDLQLMHDELVDRDGGVLPPKDELGAAIRDQIAQVGDLIGGGSPIEVVWIDPKKTKKSA
jgi:CRISPR-associated protein Csb1